MENLVEKDNYVLEDFEIDGTTLVQYKGSNPNVVIPDFITNVVAVVDDYGRCYFAFGTFGTGDCVKSIKVPKSLTYIDGWTFNMCRNLEEIIVDKQNEVYYSEGNCIIEKSSKTLIFACKTSVIPKDIKSIAYNAFVEIYPPFAEHREIIIINYNGTKAQWNGIERDTFWDIGMGEYIVHCTDGDITFDDEPFVIHNDGCLWDYRGHSTKVVIPDSVKYFLADDYEGRFCFNNCHFIKSITIPKGVTRIDGDNFHGCSNLEEIIVDSQNNKYYSQGNCVIEKENKTLIAGCKTSVIPEDVTSIGFSAFWGHTGLTSIHIPSSIKTIGNCAFENCSNLAYIILPDGITSIGSSAFYNCTSLIDIIFQGTKEQWYAIDKGDKWDYETGYFTIHCTDGDIVKDMIPVYYEI